jgi:hypothetical protein
MYRLYNNTTGEFFYTCNQNEVDSRINIPNSDWINEGAAFYINRTGQDVFYRVFHPIEQRYLWTTDYNEYQQYINVNHWRDDGALGYV